LEKRKTWININTRQLKWVKLYHPKFKINSKEITKERYEHNMKWKVFNI